MKKHYIYYTVSFAVFAFVALFSLGSLMLGCSANTAAPETKVSSAPVPAQTTCTQAVGEPELDFTVDTLPANTEATLPHATQSGGGNGYPVNPPQATTAPTTAPTEASPPPTVAATPDPTVTTPTETTPAPTETTPAPTETTPAPTETTPAPTETTPAPTETTPAPTETTLVPTETAPTETPTTDAPELDPDGYFNDIVRP